MNRRTPEQADHRQLMLWAEVYRMPSGHFGGWQPPDLASDHNHPFPRQMAPIRPSWRERWSDRLRRWRDRNDEGAVR